MAKPIVAIVVASSGNQGNTNTHADGIIAEVGQSKTIELEAKTCKLRLIS